MTNTFTTAFKGEHNNNYNSKNIEKNGLKIKTLPTNALYQSMKDTLRFG